MTDQNATMTAAEYGRTLIGTAGNQVKSLRSKAKPAADLILSASDPDKEAKAFFVAARGEYVIAKDSGQKARATELGKGWNALKSAIAYHAGTDGFSISWPNWATGTGECRVLTKEEAKGAREERKAEEEAANKEAREQAMQRAQDEQLAALRELGPEDIATMIKDQLTAWGGNKQALVECMAAVVKEMVWTYRGTDLELDQAAQAVFLGVVSPTAKDLLDAEMAKTSKTSKNQDLKAA